MSAWWRRPIFLAVLIGLVVAAGGAAVGLAVTGSKASPKPSATPKPTFPKVTIPAPTCPLTGAPSPLGAVPARPALAIKVDNFPDARPQSGLDKADVIFEEPVEGGVTRYVAVFQCQDASLIGPIRSARYPDVGILDLLNDPIFIHVGGINPILSMIRNANDDNYDLYYQGAIIQHPAGRHAPYDTYASTTAAYEANKKDTSVPPALFSYSAAAPTGIPVASVHIPFSPTSDETWTWNPTTKMFRLSYAGVPATTSSGAALRSDNVVIMHVATTTGPWLENNVGGYEVEVNPTGSGSVQVLRDGVLISGTWSRDGLGSPLKLTTSAGTPLTLAPGRTWVAMVPTAIHVTNT